MEIIPERRYLQKDFFLGDILLLGMGFAGMSCFMTLFQFKADLDGIRMSGIKQLTSFRDCTIEG